MGLENSLELAMLNQYLFLKSKEPFVVFLVSFSHLNDGIAKVFWLYDDWAAIISSRWLVITSCIRIARGCIYKGPMFFGFVFFCLGQCHQLSTTFAVLCTCPIALRMRFTTYFAGCRNRKHAICMLFAVLCTCKKPIFHVICFSLYLWTSILPAKAVFQRLLGFYVVVHFALHFACYCNLKISWLSCNHL